MSLLTFKDVSYYYQDGGKRVDILSQANYRFEKGKTYAIVGASGSGKTTSISLAGGLDVPKEGEILYQDQSLKKIGLNKYRRQNVSIVFQSYNLITYMNACQNVVNAMEIAHIQESHKKQKALDIMASLGLSKEEATRDIRKLSGGQQQRIAIARAIAKDVALILCDEPTGNLDQDTSKGIIDTFIQLAHEHNKCVIIVTHDPQLARQMDHSLAIQNGQLVETVS